MNIKNLEDHDQSVIKLKCQLEVVKKELLQSESSRQFNKFVIGSLIIVIISLVYFNDKSNNNESNDGTNNSSSSNQKNKVDFSIISTFMHSLLIFVKLFQVCDFQQLSSPVKNEFVRSHLPATYPVFRRFSLVADGQIISCNFKPSLRLLYAIHPM